MLRGDFQEIRYDHEKLSAEPNAVLFDYARNGLVGRLTDPRPVRCYELDRMSITNDAVVDRNAHDFHRLICIGGGSGLTLVRTEPPLLPTSLVIRPPGKGLEVEEATRPTAREVAMTLEEFLTFGP